MVELKFQPKTHWSGPDLTPEAEKEAELASIAVLEELDGVYSEALAQNRAPDWIKDLGSESPEASSFLLHALGKGEITINLHGGQAVIEETSIPALWVMRIGGLTSLIASLLPRSVEAVLEQGKELIGMPEKLPQGLFAAPALVSEVNAALCSAASDDDDSAMRQFDMMRQPLTPADKTFILTSIGEGPVTVELSGFAQSRIFSTKIRGLWRSVIINDNRKVLMDSLVTARVPPEIPASMDDLPHAVKLIRDTLDWIRRDLERNDK